MKARKKVLQGSTSAGKTFCVLALLIDKAAKQPETDISIIATTIQHLKKGAMKDFLRLMRMTNRFNPERWNKSEFTYTFANGSTIEFMNADEDKARGPRRDILYVNEANLVPYHIYEALAIRTKGDIYIDFNPTQKFWAHTEVMNEPDAEFIKLTYLDNEGLAETTRLDLESKRLKAATSEYWANWCRVYLDGEIGKLEGVIYQNWKEIDTIPETAQLMGYGMDWGFTNDPTTCVALYKYEGKLILDEVIYQKGLSNRDIHFLLKDNGVTGQIYSDVEPKTVSELQAYGHSIQQAKKGDGSILFGINLLQEYEFLVTKRSKYLKDELTRYSWKVLADGTTSNIPEDLNNHLLDALRYVATMTISKSFDGPFYSRAH